MRPEAILYAATDDEQGIQDAREYAHKYGLTKETTRIYKSNGQVLVACHAVPESLEETWIANWLNKCLRQS